MEQNHESLLLDPLTLDQQSADEYMHTIAKRSTGELQDDYQMIWHSMPERGYANKQHVNQVRLVIIQELLTRSPEPWRSRFAERFPHKVPRIKLPPVPQPRGYGSVV